MAKKIKTIEEKINSEFGSNIIVDSKNFLEQNKIVIPVSPQIDIVLSGGIPEGSFVTFTGQPKSGKTSLAVDFSSTALDPKYGGKFCPKGRELFIYNIEGRLKPRDLRGIKNLGKWMDEGRVKIIGSEPGNILNAEKYLQIAYDLISTKPGSIHIIDSYSALCTDAELTSEMSKMQRADGAKLLAKFCRKISNIIPVNNNIVIGVTHLMGNPTGYGPEFKEKSGQAISYQVDVKLWAKAFRAWCIPKDGGEQVGQEIDWQCIVSSLGSPGKKCKSLFRYNYGIDKESELVNLAVDIGLIDKGGAWYTLSFLGNGESDEPGLPKFQGVEKTRQALMSNSEWYGKLTQAVGSILGQ